MKEETTDYENHKLLKNRDWRITMKHEKIINNAAASGATANWEALRDLSRVMRAFEYRKVTIDVADNGDIIVTNFCYPFRMVATFEGDGVCHVYAVYDGEQVAKELYDSHWHHLDSLPVLFERTCRTCYEEAANQILVTKKEHLLKEQSLRNWAVKWSGFMIKIWGKKLSDASSTDKLRSFAAQRCRLYSDIATYLVSN